MGGAPPITAAMRVHASKYVRFSFPRIPAYAMIVEPLPGSYAVEPVRLLLVVLKVWCAPN